MEVKKKYSNRFNDNYMEKLDKILLVTDFSIENEYIIDYAIKLAQKYESEIIPIHVVPNNIQVQKVKIQLIEISTELLNQVVEKIRSAGVHAGKYILEHGSFDEEIVNAVNYTNSDIILMGLGISAEQHDYEFDYSIKKVAQKSIKPVWVVPDYRLFNLNHILCPIDLSKESASALEKAIHTARIFKAELTVFCVNETNLFKKLSPDSKLEQLKSHRRSDIKNKFERFLENFSFDKVDWDTEIRAGEPPEEIIRAIQKYDIDLLIMGKTGVDSSNKAIMGTVTERVTREALCPFITVSSEVLVK
jgi:nucleotide-binding universal stress UspA family protein